MLESVLAKRSTIGTSFNINTVFPGLLQIQSKLIIIVILFDIQNEIKMKLQNLTLALICLLCIKLIQFASQRIKCKISSSLVKSRLLSKCAETFRKHSSSALLVFDLTIQQNSLKSPFDKSSPQLYPEGAILWMSVFTWLFFLQIPQSVCLHWMFEQSAVFLANSCGCSLWGMSYLWWK